MNQKEQCPKSSQPLTKSLAVGILHLILIIDSMEKTITILQIISAIALTVVILLQNKGGGLSGVFGGSDGGNVFRTKRGMEKNFHYMTIAFSIIFFGLSIATIFVF